MKYNYVHDHPSQEFTHGHMRGAFSLGMLQGVVNGGESAKRRLIANQNLSAEEVKELQRSVWSANSAKAFMEEIKVKNGYYDKPPDDKVREIESFNFDETLKGEVVVDIYYESRCFSCEAQAHRVWDIVNPVGFKVNYFVVDGLPPPPSREWVLRDWPHILVNGHEVSMKRLGELVLDAKYIRVLEMMRTKNQSNGGGEVEPC